MCFIQTDLKLNESIWESVFMPWELAGVTVFRHNYMHVEQKSL